MLGSETEQIAIRRIRLINFHNFVDETIEVRHAGHLFLLGVHHLQALCSIAGFETRERMQTQIGWTSVILGVLLYPLFLLTTLATYRTYSRKKKDIPAELRKRVWWEHVMLNISGKTLFCKHIFWALEKRWSGEEKRRELVRMVDRSAGTESRVE